MVREPFVPAAILGGSVLVEHEPFDRTYWLRSYRGIEILAPQPSGRSELHPAYRPVLVYGCVGWSDATDPAGFESVVAALSSRVDGASLRILQTFGRMGQTRAVTLDPLEGIRLDQAVGVLRARGEHLSATLALAIACELLPFLRALSPGRDIFAGLHDFMLSPKGEVHARPIPTYAYRECYSNHVTSDPLLDGGPVHEVMTYLGPHLETPSAPDHDEAWNVFVVGVLLHELLSPWPTDDLPDTLPDVIRTLVRGWLPPVRSLRPDLPESVVSLIEWAMDYRRGERSWEALHEGLAALRSRLGPAVDRSDLVTLYESLPTELQLVSPSPHEETLLCWRQLPTWGYEPVETSTCGLP